MMKISRFLKIFSIPVYTKEVINDEEQIHYLSAEEIKERLVQNEVSIYLFASMFEYETTDQLTKTIIDAYAKAFETMTNHCINMDGDIYYIEYTIKLALGNDVHFW